MSESRPPSSPPPAALPAMHVGPVSLAAQNKIYARTLPLLCLIAALSYLDRTNLAYASLTMGRDLGFSHTVYGTGSALFFAGYSFAMIPSQAIGLRVGISRWLGIIVIAWGIVASLFSSITTVNGFYILRFLLGVTEAGAFPATWYYLYAMLHKEALVFPYSAIEASVSMANVLSAPLAGLLLMLHLRAGLRGWQWMFLIEGAATVVVGQMAWFILPPSLQQCHFLTSGEKRAMTTLQQQQGKRGANQPSLEDKDGPLHSDPPVVSWRLLKDSCTCKLIYISIIAQVKNVAMYGILFFLPSLVADIIDQGGPIVSATGDQLVLASNHRPPMPRDPGRGVLDSSAPIPSSSDSLLPIFLSSFPFMATALFALWIGLSSQARGEKTFHLTLPYSAAALLYVALPSMTRAGWTTASFLSLSMAVAFTNGPNCVLNSLVPAACPPHSVSIAMAVYNSLGNLGGLVGPWMVGRLMDQGGGFEVALPALSFFMVLAAFLSFLTRGWWEEDRGEKDGSDSNPLCEKGQGS